MARMGKQQLTPEEEARNKMLMRERDRERKRMKRMNPEYRKMEQERDRDRKKARRSNEAFRQLEKLRDKIRKDRKKGLIVDDALPPEYVALPTTVEPEVIISDVSPQTTQTHNPLLSNNHNGENTTSTNASTADTQTSAVVATSAHSSAITAVPPHMSTLNKGLLYPTHSFPHHPLPLGGVTLMPQFCHPILHQNISAPLYPPNGIKQEYPELPQRNGAPTGNNSNASSEPDREYALIEPEIILQTSSDVITSTAHHFDNHAHAHHMHQQHTGMFQHMATQQAHLAPHMRAMPPQTHAAPPPPPATTQSQQQTPAQTHAQQQQQQQQQMSHYGQRKNS